jgi:putative ABC transport system substrate-binding protein
MRRREFIAWLGGAAAWPIAAAGKPADRVPTLGYLSDEGTGPHPFRSHGSVLDELRQLGYVERQNILIEYRNVDGQVDKLPSVAAELAALPVDIIFAVGTPAAKAALGASKTIPIVFSRIGDPVAAGLVASLARPGGNATRQRPSVRSSREAPPDTQGPRSRADSCCCCSRAEGTSALTVAIAGQADQE